MTEVVVVVAMLVRRQAELAGAVHLLASGGDPASMAADTAPADTSPRANAHLGDLPDVALLTALAGGGAEADAALRVLFERHAGWLAQRLRRGLPAHAVEDVLQETFLAVWRAGSRPGAADAFAGRGDVGAWLWGIARRQAALWLRRSLRGPQRHVFVGDAAAAVDAALRSAHDTAAAAAQAVDLDAALRLLGPEGSDDRELVRLVLLEDRPLGEAAQVLQVPTGTVKSRLFRIRQRLRAALHDRDDERHSHPERRLDDERGRFPDA